MDTDRELQDVITRNVRVLMAVHGIRAQQDLAAQLGWAPARINKVLNGSQRWAIADLSALARVFHVAPGALLGETADLVTSSNPARAVGANVRDDVRFT